jgi:hypothetical protein
MDAFVDLLAEPDTPPVLVAEATKAALAVVGVHGAAIQVLVASTLARSRLSGLPETCGDAAAVKAARTLLKRVEQSSEKGLKLFGGVLEAAAKASPTLSRKRDDSMSSNHSRSLEDGLNLG